MAKRTKSQKSGSRGQRLVQYLTEKDGNWIVRGQEEDFGLDLEAELDTPSVSGALIKIQVKSCLRHVGRSIIKCRIRRSLLEYADSCRLPVLLVVVDLNREIARYVWLQEWLFEQRRIGILINSMPHFVSVPVSTNADLAEGLRSRIQDIAQCKTALQVVLSLNDAIRAAIATRSSEMALAIAEVLEESTKAFLDFPIEVALDDILRLGGSIWATEEGNQMSQLLFAICRKFGDRFTAKSVVRMVIRGEGYSRTGINALGILYDQFPEKMRKLGLPKVFAQHKDNRVRYYCLLRERYLGRTSVEILSPRSNFRIGGWDLHSDIRGDLLDKWANRGDSAILDYLVVMAQQHARMEGKKAF